MFSDFTPPAPIEEGQRIELTRMPDDPDPIPVGSQGTVEWASYLSFCREWQIGVKWDNGRSLMLIYPKDGFKTIK